MDLLKVHGLFGSCPRNQPKHATVLTNVWAVFCYLEYLRQAAVDDQIDAASFCARHRCDELDEVAQRLTRFTGFKLWRTDVTPVFHPAATRDPRYRPDPSVLRDELEPHIESLAK